ncbi:hypothetical protein HK096_010066, partial [Nowakowskiella sp. JEL0078]
EQITLPADPIRNLSFYSFVRKDLQIGIRSIDPSNEKVKFQIKFNSAIDISAFEFALQAFINIKQESTRRIQETSFSQSQESPSFQQSRSMSVDIPVKLAASEVQPKFTIPSTFQKPSTSSNGREIQRIFKPDRPHTSSGSLFGVRNFKQEEPTKRSFYQSLSNETNDIDEDLLFPCSQRSATQRSECDVQVTSNPVQFEISVHDDKHVSQHDLSENAAGNTEMRDCQVFYDLAVVTNMSKAEFIEMLNRKLKSQQFRTLLRKVEDSVGARILSDLKF